jgi:hypothetical protein
MHFWNELLSGFSHSEVDTLINLLTRLVLVADRKQGRKSRLMISDVPVAKPVPARRNAKLRKAS